MKNLLILAVLTLGISTNSFGKDLTVTSLTFTQEVVCMEGDGSESYPCNFPAYQELNEGNPAHVEIMAGLDELLPERALYLCERKTGINRENLEVKKITETQFRDRVYPHINYGGSSEWKVSAFAKFKCIL